MEQNYHNGLSSGGPAPISNPGSLVDLGDFLEIPEDNPFGALDRLFKGGDEFKAAPSAVSVVAEPTTTPLVQTFDLLDFGSDPEPASQIL
jgi:hypothetical protein